MEQIPRLSQSVGVIYQELQGITQINGISRVFMLYSNNRSLTMTEMALLDMVRKIPQSKRQELYDFAYFLVEKYSNIHSKERIAAFESEDEMIDFINDIGKQIYAD